MYFPHSLYQETTRQWESNPRKMKWDWNNIGTNRGEMKIPSTIAEGVSDNRTAGEQLLTWE